MKLCFLVSSCRKYCWLLISFYFRIFLKGALHQFNSWFWLEIHCFWSFIHSRDQKICIFSIYQILTIVSGLFASPPTLWKCSTKSPKYPFNVWYRMPKLSNLKNARWRAGWNTGNKSSSMLDKSQIFVSYKYTVLVCYQYTKRSVSYTLV